MQGWCARCQGARQSLSKTQTDEQVLHEDAEPSFKLGLVGVSQ